MWDIRYVASVITEDPNILEGVSYDEKNKQWLFDFKQDNSTDLLRIFSQSNVDAVFTHPSIANAVTAFELSAMSGVTQQAKQTAATSTHAEKEASKALTSFKNVGVKAIEKIANDILSNKMPPKISGLSRSSNEDIKESVEKVILGALEKGLSALQKEYSETSLKNIRGEVQNFVRDFIEKASFSIQYKKIDEGSYTNIDDIDNPNVRNISALSNMADLLADFAVAFNDFINQLRPSAPTINPALSAQIKNDKEKADELIDYMQKNTQPGGDKGVLELIDVAANKLVAFMTDNDVNRVILAGNPNVVVQSIIQKAGLTSSDLLFINKKAPIQGGTTTPIQDVFDFNGYLNSKAPSVETLLVDKLIKCNLHISAGSLIYNQYGTISDWYDNSLRTNPPKFKTRNVNNRLRQFLDLYDQKLTDINGKPVAIRAEEKLLFVDDTIHSGETFNAVKRVSPSSVCFTLFATNI